nr:hypothetical protein [Tanacetum cinerariifolium]
MLSSMDHGTKDRLSDTMAEGCLEMAEKLEETKKSRDYFIILLERFEESKKEATKLRAERQDLAARMRNEEIRKHNVIRHILQVYKYKQVIGDTFSASYGVGWLEGPKVNRKEEAAIFKAADNVDYESPTKFQ